MTDAGANDGGSDVHLEGGTAECEAALDAVVASSPSPNELVTVTSVTPPNGPSDGSVRVAVEGTGFETCLRVLFGDREGDLILFLQMPRRLSLRVPSSNVVDTVDVSVVTPNGIGRLQNAFSYE